MRRLVVSMAVSLDGYVTGPDGGLDWADLDAELFRAVTEETRALSAYVMGRRLYETMLFWETADTVPSLPERDTREWAAVWRALPKVVLSSTLTAVEGNARLATDDLAGEIARLRAAPGREGDISIGGATLAHAAARLDLVDEYRPRVHPVLLGGGETFFPRDADRRAMEVVERRAFGADGEIACPRYRVRR